MNCNQIWRNLFLVPLFLLFANAGFSQAFSVSGKITDADGQPLAGVTVQVKNSAERSLSRQDGMYEVAAPNGTATLVFTYVGFVEKEVSINNRNVINISLLPLNNSLENVVVVGYGTQKKKNVTGALSSFNADKLDERPLTRVDQALVGQLAGVQVKQTSGALGKGFSVQVRGAGSISAGNEPLYVIDGFPLATARPNSAGNFSTGNPLDNINPNDIESIQVLKDAAAAAIYGSRAANGVVLITTKKGRTGKPQINLNSYVGYAERSKKLDMLNAQEWIDRATEMINAQWVASGAGRTATQTNEQRRVILGLAPGNVNTNLMTDDRWTQPGHPGLSFNDWQDEAFRKGLVQNHQVSASGGNEFVHYYISGNLANQEGMVIGTDYRSYSGRANVELNASSKLKLGINLSPTYSIINDPGVEGKDNILHQLLSFTPVQEDTMGLYPNVGNNGQYRWSVSPNSPIGKLRYILGQTKRFRTLTTMFADYQIIKGLNIRTTLNLDNTDNTSKGYTPYTLGTTSLATRQSQLAAGASGSLTGFRKQTFVNENTITYSKIFHTVHDVSLLAGASYNSDKIDNLRISSNGGYSSSVINTLNAANGVTGNTTEARNVLISYFGRAQYSYDGKYLFSASIRRDGSSRFGENTRWGVFPSASVGWRISEEKFMTGISKISDLKLRGSWGTSGNYNIGDYSTIPTLAVFNYTFNGVPAIGQAPGGITNPDLSWEKSQTFDVGLDFGFINNRFTGSFDYYNRLNTQLLLNVPVSGITGFSTVLSNAGKAKNRGWEIELTSRNIAGPFTWTTSANLSHNTNRLVELTGGQQQIIIPSAYGAASEHSILRVGQPLYSIYVIKQIGIISAADTSKKVPVFGSQTVGDPKYFDANGDGKIDLNDRVIVAHPSPDYVWGITNTFRYRGFDLSFLVQGQWGGSIYSMLGRALSRTGQGFTDNPIGAFRDRWRSPDNPGNGKIGKAYSTFGFTANTDWLYSSDYVRVRNITLGYNLGSLFHTKAIQSARVYLTAENFFGWDKYTGGFNPEATNTDLSGSGQFPEPGDYGGLPLPRSIIFGINFTF